MDGRIKMYNREKGFGFILGSDGNDYFFHCSYLADFNDEVNRGAPVTFEPKQGNRGLEAKEVKIIQRAQFINFGSTRIRLSRIRHYFRTEEEITKSYNNNLFDDIFDMLNRIPTTYKESVYTVWIETYQGEQYHLKGTYSETQKIMDELDRHFGVK